MGTLVVYIYPPLPLPQLPQTTSKIPVDTSPGVFRGGKSIGDAKLAIRRETDTRASTLPLSLPLSPRIWALTFAPIELFKCSLGVFWAAGSIARCKNAIGRDPEAVRARLTFLHILATAAGPAIHVLQTSSMTHLGCIFAPNPFPMAKIQTEVIPRPEEQKILPTSALPSPQSRALRT